MKCTQIQQRLFEALEQPLDTATQASVDAHLEQCAECTSLAAALDCPEDHETALTHDVLRNTTGTACGASVERLPQWVDRTLEPIDAELVGGHVAHCGDCTQLAGVLRAMDADLAQLAEVAPDAAFVDDVLAATVGEITTPSWGARFDRWVARLIERPRIAWEGAYLATACLMLLILFPGSPLAGISQRALDLARLSPDTIEQPFVVFKSSLNSSAQEAWISTHTTARSLATRASIESSGAIYKTKQEIGTLWQQLASEPLTDETLQWESSNGENE